MKKVLLFIILINVPCIYAGKEDPKNSTGNQDTQGEASQPDDSKENLWNEIGFGGHEWLLGAALASLVCMLILRRLGKK